MDGARTSHVTAGKAKDGDATEIQRGDATRTSGVTGSAGADEAVYDTVDGDADGARTSDVTAGEAGDDDAADTQHTDATYTSGVTASAGADEAVHDTVDGDADESNDTDAPATGVGNVTDTRDVTDTTSSSKIKPKLHV